MSKFFNLFWIISLNVIVSESEIDITSSYEDFYQKEKHIWSVGLPEINITVSNFTSGVKVLKEVDATGGDIFVCSLSGSGTSCSGNNGCSCRYIGDNAYETVYVMNLADFVTKNQSIVKLETGVPPVTTLSQARIVLENCPDQNATVEPLGACEVGHFDCESSFSCKPEYVTNSLNATCLSNATWSKTINCILEPITTTLPTTTVAAATVTTSAGSAVTSSNTDSELGEYKKEKIITGGVLLGVSLAELLAYILIAFLGFIGFIKENALLFSSGAILLVTSNVCGIVLIVSATDMPWSGGNIAAAVIGYIALAIIIPVEIYLSHLLINSDYAKGHAK